MKTKTKTPLTIKFDLLGTDQEPSVQYLLIPSKSFRLLTQDGVNYIFTNKVETINRENLDATEEKKYPF